MNSDDIIDGFAESFASHLNSVFRTNDPIDEYTGVVQDVFGETPTRESVIRIGRSKTGITKLLKELEAWCDGKRITKKIAEEMLQRAIIDNFGRDALGKPAIAPKKRSAPAADPDGYVAALRGWRRELVEELRDGVTSAAKLTEVIWWGHLVYLSNGPVLLIRAEKKRVLFGFWRGKQMREIEERLKPGGKYDMATLTLTENDAISPATVKKLTRAAVKLNKKLGNPTDV
jgi:hypothetical protein